MPAELGYITLKVGEIERAQTFYRELFGWEFVGTPLGAHVKNTKLPVGLDASGPVSVPFIYFRVDDLAASTKKVEALGGSVRDRSENPSGLMAECSDDQGTVFSLWQPNPGFG